ncbi:hypothetical protein HN51_053427 [Arachis hypogaea]|uniref:Uncharacterized protein n=1 Tax=Arachis hypogaea TaxID=3818 RepID=A0A6B9V440_ARAHY|nr:uncharacterized protein DS421_19g638190 [Arachis hypogaea]
MELENCQCLSMITSYERIGGGYDDSSSSSSSIIVCVNDEESMTRLKMACWRTLWRKIKKEKKRFFNNNKKNSSSSSHVLHYQYDPNSYLQNFDDGYYCSSSDPDIFSRSFSARFAMPSKFFEKNNDEVAIEEGEEEEEEEILDQ